MNNNKYSEYTIHNVNDNTLELIPELVPVLRRLWLSCYRSDLHRTLSFAACTASCSSSLVVLTIWLHHLAILHRALLSSNFPVIIWYFRLFRDKGNLNKRASGSRSISLLCVWLCVCGHQSCARNSRSSAAPISRHELSSSSGGSSSDGGVDTRARFRLGASSSGNKKFSFVNKQLLSPFINIFVKLAVLCSPRLKDRKPWLETPIPQIVVRNLIYE